MDIAIFKIVKSKFKANAHLFGNLEQVQAITDRWLVENKVSDCNFRAVMPKNVV